MSEPSCRQITENVYGDILLLSEKKKKQTKYHLQTSTLQQEKKVGKFVADKITTHYYNISNNETLPSFVV